ncbi:hypothetical protein [Flavobacterium sp.]|uniref:hypothetical protein n=1 Tax=Flavobacterium sp. TaxID=239 RepID=UPI0039E384E5
MNYKLRLRQLALAFIAVSMVACSSDDGEEYVPVVPALESPVVVDLASVPYEKLSEYQFFEGEMKNQKPAYGLIPYAPASQLFTDYAEKKRFIWLPKGTKASYDGDGKVLQMPVGAALVKTFYYNHVQPSNTTKLIETRVMIKKASGWIFATYVWNDAQTEAYYLAAGGSNVSITWTHTNNETKTADYRIPSQDECLICHKINETAFPIGIKPQNLNVNYNYANGPKNQLQKLIELGYLTDNLPANIVTTVDFNDVTKPLNLRVRSYFDSNCAHCHSDGGQASFYALRFPFGLTENLTNMGVCVEPNHYVPGFEGRLVAPGDVTESMVYYRITTDDFFYRMPMLGRSIPHQEAIALVGDWINSITDCP